MSAKCTVFHIASTGNFMGFKASLPPATVNSECSLAPLYTVCTFTDAMLMNSINDTYFQILIMMVEFDEGGGQCLSWTRSISWLGGISREEELLT